MPVTDIQALPNAPNFRDFGGYHTRDGQQVRRGCLLRSNELNRLTAEDWQKLAAWDVQLIVDLRLLQEKERRQAQVIPGIRLVSADVLAGAGIVHDGLPPGGWTRVVSGDGAGVMQDLYRGFVSEPRARAAYGSLLRAVLECDGAALIHCVAGQDRTGWAAAVLLTALGVPYPAVLDDYLVSARAMSRVHTSRIRKDAARMAALGVTEANVAPLYWVNESYLAAGFAQVQSDFGSFANYLVTGLNFDEASLRTLRSRLLEPVAAEITRC